MADPFQSIRESCQVIEGAKFDKPGIFTNAILSRPEVTTLIRDALIPERALYKISHKSGLSSSTVKQSNDDAKSFFTDLSPERTDGKTSYAAPDASLQRTHAVAIPQLVHTPSASGQNTDVLLSPSRRRSLIQKLVSDDVLSSDDAETMCQALISLLDQYPNLQSEVQSKNDIIALQNELQTVSKEILALEREVTEQGYKLDRHNDNLNELSPRRGNFSPKKTLSVDEMIRNEELEIEELERELEKRSFN